MPTEQLQDTEGLERLCRYLLRCPLSLSRIHCFDDWGLALVEEGYSGAIYLISAPINTTDEEKLTGPTEDQP